MTRPNGRKHSGLQAKAAPSSPLHAVMQSDIISSRTMRKLKELMEIDRKLWCGGEDSMEPMLEACLAKVEAHDEEPTEEQARREDAFDYVVEVLRNQEEDAASAVDAEEGAEAPEMSDMWP